MPNFRGSDQRFSVKSLAKATELAFAFGTDGPVMICFRARGMSVSDHVQSLLHLSRLLEPYRPLVRSRDFNGGGSVLSLLKIESVISLNRLAIILIQEGFHSSFHGYARLVREVALSGRDVEPMVFGKLGSNESRYGRVAL